MVFPVHLGIAEDALGGGLGGAGDGLLANAGLGATASVFKDLRPGKADGQEFHDTMPACSMGKSSEVCCWKSILAIFKMLNLILIKLK